ncbi:MAG: hypothetical protein QM526_02075 [Alphaproteobacteria bacterium]|nr:hypothetical protein [Alphaproteobacteria bacterium]
MIAGLFFLQAMVTGALVGSSTIAVVHYVYTLKHGIIKDSDALPYIHLVYRTIRWLHFFLGIIVAVSFIIAITDKTSEIFLYGLLLFILITQVFISFLLTKKFIRQKEGVPLIAGNWYAVGVLTSYIATYGVIVQVFLPVVLYIGTVLAMYVVLFFIHYHIIPSMRPNSNS